MNSIKYLHIDTCDMKNGTGIRSVLWTAGCSHHCEKCQNPFTWDIENGSDLTQEDKEYLISTLRPSYVQGLTLSGGDPLYKMNRDAIGKLVQELKEKLPNKDIWLYTGYTVIFENGNFLFVDGEDTFALDWLPFIDVIVDGKYEDAIRLQDLKKGMPKQWAGSSNQRVINVKKSLKQSKIAILQTDTQTNINKMPNENQLRQLYRKECLYAGY